MVSREIKPGIFSVGAIDWDRRLFDELVPLPHGTSYNSYLVVGSTKTALVDTVYPAKTAEYMASLKRLGIKKIDYIVANHGEQDHSGSIPAVLEAFPDAKVVTNPVCKTLIADALDIADDKFIEIKDRETLSLGNKTLQFIYAPWVHWPDTMMTYIAEDRVLFTCDFLGSHLATSDLFAVEEPQVLESAKRYYAEIMMPYSHRIGKHLKVIDGLDVEMIGPSHGPVYNRPALILDAYKTWVSPEAKPEVIVPHVSMYANTTTMVNYLVDRLMEKGIKVTPFNCVEGDLGELAKLLVEASTVVFAAPTVLNGPHPAIATAAYLANVLKPKTKVAGIIGSFGWGGKMVNDLKGLISNLKVEFLKPVLTKGKPKEQDFKALDEMAEEIYRLNAPATPATKAAGA